ncbi:hypothetical protein [Candidatus Mycobacterium methanotrophicum]|uniref:Uncharacterized protein n=1 Tax=Candidatus Mycobacterium methanotrophicum TaxID=2943498 RepID=A0ABY4QJU2_9MYCO|nr:hypothetical protein [Candidatus Mycobacterium methanotrophicum]UQX10101.1 hypothetical protein M5I08_18120 [Candidatus Mycobacterium methanotrophicum]
MSDFDYRPQPGFLSEWSLSVSGYDDPVLNGQVDILPPRQLVELEIEIRTWEEDYAEETGAALTRVHGGSG